MKDATVKQRRRSGFTMLELMVAVVASTFLLAGLGSVMFIARQVAYTPSAATRRAKTADIINLISDELRYATIILQQTPQILEFVVADRNNDGTAEKIRYEWSGAAGDPLRKTINGGTAVDVLTSVYAFNVTLQQKAKTTTLTTTTDSAEALLQSNATVISGSDRDLTTSSFEAQQINPSAFAVAVPANAITWNATKIDFQGRQRGAPTDTLLVQIRHTGDPYNGPTSNVIGQASVAASTLTSNTGWNTVVFSTPIRNLAFQRNYALVLAPSVGNPCRVNTNDTASSGVLESDDTGASWQYISTRQIFYRLYGTYSTPGTSYNVTRNYVSYVRLGLQAGNQSHARIDTSIPMRNLPELLATYWRTDFDSNPATTDGNGDATADWAVTGGGNFDTTKLVGGVWTATGAIETRPLSDFITTTTVEARCRNTSVGGNGAVVAIYVDRQGGQYAPLLVYIQKQSDGTQTFTLNGKTSDTIYKQLFSRTRLSSSFVRFRLTILPNSDVVNLQINDEDQGSFTYPKYAPTTTSDRYLTLYADTSSAEFDYVDVRAGIN
jgi:hypothetical protein